MAVEGEFPKVNGDILYASEVNKFSAVAPTFSSATEVSHTGNTNETTLKTITVGGGFSGTRLIFLTFQAKDDTGGGNSNLNVRINSVAVNFNLAENGRNSTFNTSGTIYSLFTIPLEIANGDVITITVQNNLAGTTGFVKNLNIYSMAGNTTFI